MLNSILLDPLVRVLSSLGCNTPYTCWCLQINLKPLVSILLLGPPSVALVKPGSPWCVCRVIHRACLHVTNVDSLVCHSKRQHALVWKDKGLKMFRVKNVPTSQGRQEVHRAPPFKDTISKKEVGPLIE